MGMRHVLINKTSMGRVRFIFMFIPIPILALVNLYPFFLFSPLMPITIRGGVLRIFGGYEFFC